ncbi:MAG TPA: M4 family metallopeptidase [Thermoanaerobaculia bacterium]|jgi:Zn-dependent metalloprotease
MKTIPHPVCGVIPPHILDHIARSSAREEADHARSTLVQMREIQRQRVNSFAAFDETVTSQRAVSTAKKRINVYDAQHQQKRGKLARNDHKARSADVDVNEAYDGSGATFDFFAKVFSRNSVDGRGMPLDSTVHWGRRFDNALWDGRQMIYGDGDGRLFGRFTRSYDVIVHEHTHGVTQHAAVLSYSGETGALNEHISDAFGSMAKQFKLRQTAREADWYIGSELFTAAVRGKAIRSMAAPGTAYDDPILGRDPQPAHMRGYIVTDDDNGGVHINSGIPNHAFYLDAIELGGYSWEVLGRIWYVTLTERLTADADFFEFASATIDVAGELFSIGGRVQEIVANGWLQVGIRKQLFAASRTFSYPPMNTGKEISVMSTAHTDIQHHDITTSISTIGTAGVETESSAIAGTANGRVQRLVEIYGSIKPLLVALSTQVILPPSWRDGIKVFVGALDAVAVVAPQFSLAEIVEIDDPRQAPEFKAGKDLTN